MQDTTTEASAESTTSEPTRPSRAVLDAVATAEDVDPVDLPPLYDVVDPEKLDALFAPLAADPATARSRGEVRFRYAGHEVVVSASGTVDLREA